MVVRRGPLVVGMRRATLHTVVYNGGEVVHGCMLVRDGRVLVPGAMRA